MQTRGSRWSSISVEMIRMIKCELTYLPLIHTIIEYLRPARSSERLSGNRVSRPHDIGNADGVLGGHVHFDALVKCRGTVINQGATDIETIHQSCGNDPNIASMGDIKRSLQHGCQLEDVRGDMKSLLHDM